jgi:hypothetical protein
MARVQPQVPKALEQAFDDVRKRLFADGQRLNKKQYCEHVVSQHTSALLAEIATFHTEAVGAERDAAWAKSRFGRTLQLSPQRFRTECAMDSEYVTRVEAVAQALADLEVAEIGYKTVAMTCLMVVATNFDPVGGTA